MKSYIQADFIAKWHRQFTFWANRTSSNRTSSAYSDVSDKVFSWCLVSRLSAKSPSDRKLVPTNRCRTWGSLDSVRRTSSIIPCRNASCNILRICFNGSEMTTCLINDQINDKRKMSILSEETLLESGTLFKKNFQSRSLDTCAANSTQCPNFRGLFTSKITWYYTWNLKPKRWISRRGIQ